MGVYWKLPTRHKCHSSENDMVYMCVFIEGCVRQWQQGYIWVYFLFKAEAAQETTEADCHSAALEMGNHWRDT